MGGVDCGDGGWVVCGGFNGDGLSDGEFFC